MDLLNELSVYRNEVQEYIRPHLSNKSYVWCRGVLNDIVRSSMLGTRYGVVCKEIIALSNFKRFFEEHASDVTPGGIIVTLYIMAIQLGLKSLGDEVETYEEFIEQIDEDDWSLVDKDQINNFDLLMHAQVIENMIYEGNNEITACGIKTLISIE